MTNWKRSNEQVRREFNLTDGESSRVSALVDVLARVPHEDYQRLFEIKESFTWFIPHTGIGGVVAKELKKIVYLSPELEHAAIDIVGAYAAHEMAHIMLAHTCEGVNPELRTKNAVEEIAAWKLAFKWGYDKEINKLKGTLKRRKTREGDLVSEWIGTALAEANDRSIKERVGKPSEKPLEMQPEKLPQKRSEKSKAGKPLALIIEDDKDSARLYSRILIPMGYDYQIVPDQEAAISMLNEIEPQMVLLDMSLTKWKRDTAGAVILNKIRQDERLKDTRVIVVTAYSVLADEVVNDVEGILIKPISAVKLKDLIEAAE